MSQTTVQRALDCLDDVAGDLETVANDIGVGVTDLAMVARLVHGLSRDVLAMSREVAAVSHAAGRLAACPKPSRPVSLYVSPNAGAGLDIHVRVDDELTIPAGNELRLSLPARRTAEVVRALANTALVGYVTPVGSAALTGGRN